MSDKVMEPDQLDLKKFLDETLASFDAVLETHTPDLTVEEIGTVKSTGRGIAWVDGLYRVQAEEVVRFSSGLLGFTFTLERDEIGIILLGDSSRMTAGERVYRTGRVADIPVGDALIGRVINATGQPLDLLGPLHTNQRSPVERPATGITQREPVNVPLQTGIKVIDALFPIGRGQRELILGDRQTGKTALALDTIINQKDKDVLCVYCAIGQRASAVAKLVDDLRKYGAMEYSIVVVASGEDAAGLQFLAPYAATSIAEYFIENGRDVLIVYDDLTRHARAYRQLTLLLRRPPGREAFPGDIFYIHSRLLERSTNLRDEFGGGSLTALPIVETEAQNISAYSPTNIISITDGQIYLSPVLFQRGILPAIDVGRSVSRVGGRAQLPAYRAVAGNLRLSYAQFEELEVFARFGTRLEPETRRQLERGQRVREVLKQTQFDTIPMPEQIAVLLAVVEGLLDALALERVAEAEGAIREAVKRDLPDLYQEIQAGKELETEDRQTLLSISRRALEAIKG
jgi:F-type H+/Na+-transporting ATPase subunit alpha